MLLLLSWLVAAGCGQVWSIGCGSKEVEGSTLGRAEGELLLKRQTKLHLPKNKSNKLFRILICLGNLQHLHDKSHNCEKCLYYTPAEHFFGS
jgi:hypothetical protein